jgi:peptidyl-prolyl cis-trans isomerase C
MKFTAFASTFALVTSLLLGGAAPTIAQDADPVVARVDGREIRQSDLALAEADIGSNLPPSAPEARRDALLSYLIDITILANAAEAKKFTETAGFDRRVAFARQKVLMEALLDQEAKTAASEAAMKKLYDDSVQKAKPEEEVRARHILVETEDKAKDLLKKLKSGADFAQLAKAESKDTGSSDGGDLGYFTKEQMVPEFAEVAFKLASGSLSDPVKTQFGWHIIKVEDKRTKAVPAFEAVKDDIRTYLARRAQAELVGQLRQAAKIDRPAPAGAPAAVK